MYIYKVKKKMLVIKSQKQAEVNFIHALLSRLEVAKQTVTV